MTDEQLIERVARAIWESQFEAAWPGDDSFDAKACRQMVNGAAQAAIEAYRSALPSTQADDEVRDIPRDVVEQVLSMGRVEWGATDKLTASGHIEHLEKTLRLTREHFNFEDLPVAMHGLYLAGTETVLCHTGTSPNSGPNARALAGAWNNLHDRCAALAKVKPNE